MSIKDFLMKNLENSREYLEASTAGYFDHKSWKIDLKGTPIQVVGSACSNSFEDMVAIKPFLSKKYNSHDIIVVNTPQPMYDIDNTLEEDVYYNGCIIILVDGANLDFLKEGNGNKIHFKNCEFYRAYRALLNPEKETFCGGGTTGTYCLNLAHYFKREEPEMLKHIIGMKQCWSSYQYYVDRNEDVPHLTINGINTKIDYLQSYFYILDILKLMGREDIYNSPLLEQDQDMLLTFCLRGKVYEGKMINKAKFSGENIILTFDKGVCVIPKQERIKLFV